MIPKRYYLYLSVILALVLIGSFVVLKKRSIDIRNGEALAGSNTLKGIITGLPCNYASYRPLAVMLSSDPEARPLSGISQADTVFEMPVTPNGVTRMMAVFQCERPKEIGSIRSARLDFVPLALGLDTLYAHFGGEHTILEKLDSGVINNIDGLKYDGTTYYRKSGVPRPHNAFTSFDLLIKTITDLGYNQRSTTTSYLHEKKSNSLGIVTPPAFYAHQFSVTWQYDAKTNSYLRSRNGKAETDKNTNKQVSVQNVAELKTTWSPISDDYLRIQTVGKGLAKIYKNGEVVNGSWEKKEDKSKLYFYDNKGIEIQFVSGKIWVEITAPLP